MMEFPGFHTYRVDCSVISSCAPLLGYIAKSVLGEFHIQEQPNARYRKSPGR